MGEQVVEGCLDCPHADICAGLGKCEIGAAKLAARRTWDDLAREFVARTCAEEERADAAEARLASVPALVEALRLLTDYGPLEDTSRWNAMDSGHRLALIQAREALTVYEQSQRNTE